MRARLMPALAVALFGAAAFGGGVLATAPSGVTSTIFAVGHVGEIDAKTLSSNWQARIDTKCDGPPACRVGRRRPPRSPPAGDGQSGRDGPSGRAG